MSCSFQSRSAPKSFRSKEAPCVLQTTTSAPCRRSNQGGKRGREAGGLDKLGTFRHAVDLGSRHGVLRRRKGYLWCSLRARFIDGDNGWYKSTTGNTAGANSSYRERKDEERDGGIAAFSRTTGSENSQSVPQENENHCWRVQILIVGTCMLLCNLDRVAMGILAVPLLTEFNISLTQMGVLQSSYLWGYLAAQIPAGIASDKYGGVRVMLCGLFLWSLATCGTALAKFSTMPLTIAVLSRVVMGLGSAVALPAVGATVAKQVPSDQKARATTFSYALFNVGNVVANLCTPYVSEFVGWHWSFLIYGAIGICWTLVALQLLKASKGKQKGNVQEEVVNVESSSSSKQKPLRLENLMKFRVRKKFMVQLLILMYCHSTIGLGYFTLQSWIPTFMAKDLGITSLKVAGICTALVWLATSFNTAFVGVIADKLLNKMPSWKVRRAAMTISTIIPASCFFILSLPTTPLIGVFCILFGLVSWSCDYAGFHPYIVEVAGNYSGTVLSLTNSAGIVAGIVGNIATGYLVGLEGNFTRVFKILAVVYLLSCILWNMFMKGEKLEFTESGKRE